MKKTAMWLVLLVLAALLALVLWPRAEAAPDFALKDLHGNSLTQQNLHGKVTLINFWYPSCPGCVSEMPKLVQTAKDYAGKDFQILAISEPYDPLESVKNYAASRGLPFAVMYDADGSVGKAFGTKVYPTSFFINKKGEILKTFVGEPDFAALYREIDKELEK